MVVQDMMDDMMDDSMAQFDDKDAENELVNQVMDEIGLAVDDQMQRAPRTAQGTRNGDTSDLLSRMDKLRTGGDNKKPK